LARHSNTFIALGKIVKPHGLKGWVQVYPYSEDTTLLESDTVYIQDKKGHFVPFYISSARLKKKNVLLIKLDDVTDRNSAEALTGLELFQAETELPPTEEDEYYWFQLKGLIVKDRAGKTVGRVKDINSTGGPDLLVVEDNKGREILVPMVKDIIYDIKLDAGICYVDMPEGLAEINQH
jgi:16S rRNA processing protein RimM